MASTAQSGIQIASCFGHITSAGFALSPSCANHPRAPRLTFFEYRRIEQTGHENVPHIVLTTQISIASFRVEAADQRLDAGQAAVDAAGLHIESGHGHPRAFR